jgi:undecaprenyl-diphosphatase
MHFLTPDWEMALFWLLNREWRTPCLDWLAPIVSDDRWPVLIGIVAFLGLWRARGLRRAGLLLFLLAAIGVADGSTNIMKDATGRVRPLNAMEGVHYHEEGEWRVRPEGFGPLRKWGSSYPSAHAANTAAVAILCMAFFGLRGWVLIIPLAVGWSRVYLGKHFPTDVAAGWLWGACVAVLVWCAFAWLRNAFAWRRIRREAAAAPPGRSLGVADCSGPRSE